MGTSKKKVFPKNFPENFVHLFLAEDVFVFMEVHSYPCPCNWEEKIRVKVNWLRVHYEGETEDVRK